MVTDVSKDNSPFIFKVKQYKARLLLDHVGFDIYTADFLIRVWDVRLFRCVSVFRCSEGLPSLQTWRNANTVTHRHIPGDLSHVDCFTLKTKTLLLFQTSVNVSYSQSEKLECVCAKKDMRWMLVIYRVLKTLQCPERTVTITWKIYLEEELHVTKDRDFGRRH